MHGNRCPTLCLQFKGRTLTLPLNHQSTFEYAKYPQVFGGHLAIWKNTTSKLKSTYKLGWSVFFCQWLVTLKQHCNVDILRVNPGSNLLVWLCILASAGNSFCCKEYFFCLSVNFLVNISWQCNCNGRFSRTMWCDEFFWRSTISKDVF